MGRTRGLTASDVVGMIDGDVGAYVHVPFCARICPFCPYNKVVPRPGQPTAYFEALDHEVAAYLDAGAAGPRGLHLAVRGRRHTDAVPRRARRAAGPHPRRSASAPSRCCPRTPLPQRLDALRDMGFTAVSIGAQSFHDEVLHRLRRPHDARAARAAVVAAAGRFDLVDVDLIVDVELDDRLSGAFLRDLTDCFALGVDQVSTYPLMRFGYTPFGTARHDRRREHEVLAAATRIAADHGYERRIGLDLQPARPRRPTRPSPVGASWAWAPGRRRSSARTSSSTTSASRPTSTPWAGGRPPVARWLHLGPLGGTAYDAFWQAYAGRISPAALATGSPRRMRGLDAALAPLVAAGLVRRVGTGGTAEFALTARGFDRLPRPRARRHLPLDRAALGPDARGARTRGRLCVVGHAGPATGRRRRGRSPAGCSSVRWPDAGRLCGPLATAAGA